MIVMIQDELDPKKMPEIDLPMCRCSTKGKQWEGVLFSDQVQNAEVVWTQPTGVIR